MKGKDLSDARILRTPDGIKTHLIFLNNLKCASDEAEPTETHRMIKRMHDRGALARIYTQNNDARDRAEQSKRRAGMLGSVRPAITLHGGSSISPDWDRSIGEMAAFDRSQRPDMIPVMGTSLKVHGFRVLLRDFAQGVGNVLVNRIDVATGDWAEIFDHVMLGASDDFARQLQLLEPIKTSATVENASLLSVTARAVIDLTLDD
ncbi:uncharacterized protein L969DRAFT_91375 [Mixia osmundae IAM 14324]|uniref:Deacetylase sirtuin-type domain-containing protein n=1 Tax=Mixia osmundae (strain CBS 9802 / IAM 14324 / JCM 22182 / KY 12970) TaxID=764103 RepID=G7E793_MIXOS|nr:uncharacterized protein L969DRAFT_91375 [Mixia osmundae IAM 14324]KEI41903.1 hypothetical protein L969DRAFT_91375 [Mixia osmundae IAM 14324]GAA98703.1 hypothetical protein E5Q_05391 [Mixia osmundae IAM 14324]